MTRKPFSPATRFRSTVALPTIMVAAVRVLLKMKYDPMGVNMLAAMGSTAVRTPIVIEPPNHEQGQVG